MARNHKGPPQQAKHFKVEDHAHAAHQQDAARGHAQKPSRGSKDDETSEIRGTVHPVELTPKGPSKGQ